MNKDEQKRENHIGKNTKSDKQIPLLKQFLSIIISSTPGKQIFETFGIYI